MVERRENELEATDEQIKKVLWEINNMVYGEKRVYTAMEVMATNLFGKKETEEILAKSKDKTPSDTQPWEQRRLRIEELKAGIIASPDGSDVLLDNEPADVPEVTTEENPDGNLVGHKGHSISDRLLVAWLGSIAIVVFFTFLSGAKLKGNNADFFCLAWGIVGVIIFMIYK